MLPNIRTNVTKDYARLALFVFPENKEFLRGKRQRLVNQASPWNIFVALIFVLVSLALVGVSVFFGYRHYQLTTNANTTTGVHISHDVYYDSDGDTYHIQYAYAVDDLRYEREEQVSEGTYNQIVAGASFFVTYNQENPHIATIGEPSLTPFAIVSILAVIFSISSWSLLFRALRRNALSKHLSDGGLMLAGQVVSATGRVGEDENTERDTLWLDVKYSFISPKTQKEILGNASNTRPELHGSRGHIGRTPGIFAPGDPLLILYADDKRHTVL